MARLLLNLDVDDIERAIEFYTAALGLTLGRRFDEEFVELTGGEIPIYLLAKDAGSAPFDAAKTRRDYERHWTPLHLDFAVDDIDAALARVRKAGGSVESEISEHVYGRLALCADPFGHGFCLLEFRGRGYGEIELAR
jgi:predicted enzyme related to lactoylglutathione lyase